MASEFEGKPIECLAAVAWEVSAACVLLLLLLLLLHRLWRRRREGRVCCQSTPAPTRYQ